MIARKYKMILLLTIFSAVTLLTSIGTAYYVFFLKPDKWRKLGNDIENATETKRLLLLSIESIAKNKAQIEFDYNNFQIENKSRQDKLISETSALQEKLQSEINELRIGTTKLQNEWKELSDKIQSGEKQIQIILNEKRRAVINLEEISSEIEKLDLKIKENTIKTKNTTAEIALLTEQKKSLLLSIESISSQFKILNKDVATIAERKSDLEKENSHLSLEIAKKKILIGEI